MQFNFGYKEKIFVERYKCKILSIKDIPYSAVKNLSEEDYNNEEIKELLSLNNSTIVAFKIQNYIAIDMYNDGKHMIFNAYHNKSYKKCKELLLSATIPEDGSMISYVFDQYYCFVNMSDNDFLKLKLSI